MQSNNYNRQVIDLKQEDKGYVSVGNKSYGYCKIETRGNKCRIKLSVNGLIKTNNNIYKACLIKTTQSSSDIIPIGVIELDKNNFANLNINTDTNNIMKKNISIDDISIIAIICKENDNNFRFPLVGYIKEIDYPWKRNININKKNRSQQIVEKSLIKEDRIEENKAIEVNLKDDKTDINNPRTNTTKAKTNADVYNRETGNDKSVEIDDIGNQTFDIIKDHFDEKELTKIYDNIFKEYPKMKPFEGKYSDIEWIRIEPADIIYFPIESWLLTNNTFLLNAYRKYKHLILGRDMDCDRGKPYFILGVPGIYYPKDKVAAYFYGFKNFVCCSGAKTKSGEYGYWIKEIDCPM
ncbi:hypothetical protein AN1V17_39320 [Vallitalea sediminicola]